jgi:signal transduction histidine kinase
MSNTETVALFWGKLADIGVSFISPCVYAFSVAYLKLRRQKKIVVLGFIISAVFGVLSQTNYFCSAVKKYPWGYYTVVKLQHIPFLVLFFMLVLASLYNFHRGYKQESQPIEKERRRLLFIAFFVGYTGSIDWLASYKVPIYPFGYLFVFLLFSILAYSIVKYRLMDIETIIHRIIIYTLLSSLVLLAYGGMIILIQVFLRREAINIKEVIATSFFITIFLALISPLKDKTQHFVDRIFYKDKYDYRKTLEKFAKKLSLFLDSPDLLHTITSTIAETIHIDKVSLMLFDKKSNRYVIRESQGLSGGNISVDKDNSFVNFLQAYGNIVEKELLMIDPKLKDARPEGSVLMKELEAELVIPLIVQRGLIGILSLGKKLSGEGYKIEDINLLSTVGQEIAVAVSNYLLYEGLEKTNRELQEAQSQLIQSAKMAAVGQLGAGVAHELNNPLGGILGYSQFMLDKLNRPGFGPDDFKSCRGYIESIERESNRCKNIVSNLLRFSRKSIVDRPELIDIGLAIKETFSIMEHQLKMCNVNVVVNIQPDLTKVMGGVNLLQQVFTNLILNAQQAMPTGGELTITVQNLLDEKTKVVSMVKIEFTDTGCGIPEENLTRIFEPFFTTKTEKGTGLGLSISYQIIQDHKGKIEVKSQLGKGSTFTITLPAG